MKGLIAVLSAFSLALVGSFALAATPGGLALTPHNILRNDGALQGGAAGRVTSLLDVRRTSSKDKKTERMVIDIGDAKLAKLQGKLGYYTVEMKKGRQIIVNFNQTLNSKLNEKEFKKRLVGSSYIQSSKMLFDPMSQTLSLVMDLKKPVAMKVVSISGSRETGKLVLDLTENRVK